MNTGAWTGPVCETRSNVRFWRSSFSSATGFLGCIGRDIVRIPLRFFFFGGDFFSFLALGGLSVSPSVSICVQLVGESKDGGGGTICGMVWSAKGSEKAQLY